MSREQVADEALKLNRLRQKRNLRRVITATGIVLHTNLGRANLSERAIEGVCEAAAHYSTLEYDLKKPDYTCMIYFSENKKKLEKEAVKVKAKYKKSTMVLQAITSDKFSFKKPEE